MKLVGYCEGFPVYAADKIIMLRDGAGLDQAMGKAARGAKRAGESPVIVMSSEQLVALQSEITFEQSKHEAECKRAQERGRKMPEPLPESALRLAVEPAPELAPEAAPAAEPVKRSRRKAEPAPAVEPQPEPVEAPAPAIE